MKIISNEMKKINKNTDKLDAVQLLQAKIIEFPHLEGVHYFGLFYLAVNILITVKTLNGFH